MIITNASPSGIVNGVTFTGSVSSGFLNITTSALLLSYHWTQVSTGENQLVWLQPAPSTANRTQRRVPVAVAATNHPSVIQVVGGVWGEGLGFFSQGSNVYKAEYFSRNGAWLVNITRCTNVTNTSQVLSHNTATSGFLGGIGISVVLPADPFLMTLTGGTHTRQAFQANIMTNQSSSTSLSLDGNSSVNGYLVRQAAATPTNSLKLGLNNGSYHCINRGNFALSDGTAWKLNYLSFDQTLWWLYLQKI